MNNSLQATAEAHFTPAADDGAREEGIDARVDTIDCAEKPYAQDKKNGTVSHAGDAKHAELNKEVAKTWLDWQCKMIAGIISGALYLPAEDGATIRLVSSWPADTDGELSLAAVAQRVAQNRRSEVIQRHKYGPGNQRVCDLIASPLVSDGKVLAIVCCGVSTRSEAQQQAILKLLQWGCLWLDTLLHQQSTAAREYGTFVNQMLAVAMTHQSSHAASIEITNQLAEHFGCERVSLGYSNAMQIRLRAISHLSDYDPRTEMARQIEAAMEEAVNQNQLIAVPTVGAVPKSQDMISHGAHDNLAKCQKHQTICSVPLQNGLQGDLQTIGAITFERADRLGFTRDELAHFTLLAKVVGPILALKYREERSIPAMLAESCRKKLAALIGPEKIKLKLGAAFALCTVFLLSVVEGNYRITAPASIEAESRQVIVAPIDGYIHRVERRAGDLVKKGELIAALKDDTLQLEKQKWEAEYLKVEKEYQQALAERDRSKLSIFRAKLDQLDAERQLAIEKLSRAQLVAPFEGIIVSGDLSQSLGAPVKTGEVLFEIAPLNNYRVIVEIDEFDMQGLSTGNQGRLIMAALPNKPLDVTLDQFIPVAVAEDGRNFFRTEATIAGDASDLRPGMRGVAKIQVGQRSLLWIWTHSVVDRVRLWAWSIGL